MSRKASHAGSWYSDNGKIGYKSESNSHFIQIVKFYKTENNKQTSEQKTLDFKYICLYLCNILNI